MCIRVEKEKKECVCSLYIALVCEIYFRKVLRKIVNKMSVLTFYS